ncbi:HAD-IC family P-type ATPase [Streptomyces sp. NPDC018693]|uniref:cation-translocating P-type ATPase n=1 Tax=unclassified Streptomyces TaxID=2593676 RepID=UPI0037AA38DB
MATGPLSAVSAAAAGFVLAGPRLLARGAAPAVGLAAGAVAGGARGAVRTVDAAARVGRVARAALPGGGHDWRSGPRAHLALRPIEPDRVRRAGGREAAARRVAAALARHPEVLYAYWDGGLARLVVSATEDAVTERVLGKAAEAAERHGLGPFDGRAEETPDEPTHPGDPRDVRTAAGALLADVAGTAAAVTGSALRLPPSPRFVTAGVTMLRENPRFRAWLRARLGRSRRDLLLTAANAAAHGAGQTPTGLVLDGTLRACELAEALARGAAFDTLHDRLCAPDRACPTAAGRARPPLRTTPAEGYANSAEAGGVLGAAAALLVKHDTREAAEAVLAGSPKAARYGPAAFNAVLGCALARSGVLVRDTDRLRRLETADTLVLHPSALRAPGGGADPWIEAVLDAARRARLRVVVMDDPALEDFVSLADHVLPADRPLAEVVTTMRERTGGVIAVARPGSAAGTAPASAQPMSGAADAANDSQPDTGADARPGPASADTTDAGGSPAGPADGADARSAPAPSGRPESSDAGSAPALGGPADEGFGSRVVHGTDVGSALAETPEPSGARPAPAPVDPADDGFGSRVVHGTDARSAPAETSEPSGVGSAPAPTDAPELPGEGSAPLPGGTIGVGSDEDLRAGLAAADLAVALADGGGPVVWAADVVAPHGLADLWRLLVAVPAGRTVGRRSQTLARSGAALSGLLVAVGESRQGGRRGALPGLRHAPVDAAAAAALLSGGRAALGVALARTPHPRARVAWHALRPKEVQHRLAHLEQEEHPGTLDEAAARAHAAMDTAARVPALAPARWGVRLARAVRSELDDPLTPVLVVGSAASAILGSVVDALLVVGALDLNALVGGVQRLRAERALAGLRERHQQKARIGTEDSPDGPHTVDAAELSPGDVITLQADDVVPADARLLWQDGLEVDESALTGESLPVDKEVRPTPHAPVADRRCMVFEGTTVVAGHARAVVVETGDRTEAARAVSLAARTPPSAGVQARLRELTQKALPLTLAGGAAVTGLALLRGTPIRQAVSGGVAVAVAAVPEGLPLVATVAQLAAARRLSRSGVLVRAPRTLEALGRMDTVCFDKTGTLTENRLRLVRVADAAGTGHRPDDTAGAAVVRTAARACPRLNGGPERPAHATDEAVLDAAGEDPHWTQAEGLPFEAARGYAAAVGRVSGDSDSDAGRWLVVKGAPETILPACAGLPGSAADAASSLARDGLRVLAVARRRLPEAEGETEVLEQPLEELEFTGLLALADVPRGTSTELVRGLREDGVRPVMLTGDHPQTARSIAVELGWPEDTSVVTGDELAAADRSERARLLRDAGVVARVAPEQKLQVVEALRDAGRVVGMVGDGANDAAAIRAADIGVGLSTRGSAAARNAADVVLTGDDLRVLIEAIDEGRALWRSVADAIVILIGGNAGEVGFGMVGTLLGRAAPLSTRQMLLVNLFTDLFPAMAVTVTPKQPEPGEAASGPLGTSLLGAPLIERIRHRALTTCLGAVTAWLIGRFTPGTARRSTTMALCALVGTQLAQTLTDRRDSPLVRATALGSAAVLALLVQTPGASQAFGCTPLGPLAWAGVAAAIALAVTGQRALPRLEQTIVRLAR